EPLPQERAGQGRSALQQRVPDAPLVEGLGQGGEVDAAGSVGEVGGGDQPRRGGVIAHPRARRGTAGAVHDHPQRPPGSQCPPHARSVSAPPAATGSGSASATTTRATPASIRACEQGPVRPVWSHGSSVTTAVPPRAASPASRSATRSACGPPGGLVRPAATG